MPRNGPRSHSDGADENGRTTILLWRMGNRPVWKPENRSFASIGICGVTWTKSKGHEPALIENHFARIDVVASGSYYAPMRSVGLKILKNKLSEYVRIAASGEIVLVTDRDRVVAELGPPQAGRSPILSDALLAEAVREGWVTPPMIVSAEPPPRRPIMKLRDLLKDIESDREDR
jgi:antitoxin (DNA-binding transcriptional repressor) of toxin-antitoxin stability system